MRFPRPYRTHRKRTERENTVLQDKDGKPDEEGKPDQDSKKDQDVEQDGRRAAGKEKILMNLAYPLISSRPFRKLLEEKKEQETGSSKQSVDEDY